jgi:hypothetical protein
MDLSWIQQLPCPVRTLLLGASGSFTGGLAANLPDGLGRGVDFETCIARFVEAFSAAAAFEPELQEAIKIGHLRELAVNTRQLVKVSKKQSDSLKRIEDRIAPGFSGLRRNYLLRIAEQCRFLPLRGIDFKSSDATCDVEERIGLAEV